MSNERKEQRLLPFRARRRGAPDSVESTNPPGLNADKELAEVLRSWDAPAATTAARERLLAAFREHAVPAPLWKRLLAMRIQVPAPVAASVIVALLGLSAALVFGRTPVVTLEASPVVTTLAPVETNAVPVPPERIVTRIVYLEKKDERRARAGGRTTAPAARRQLVASTRNPGEGNGYFTGVNMLEFQPADEMKIRIIKKGNADEN